MGKRDVIINWMAPLYDGTTAKEIGERINHTMTLLRLLDEERWTGRVDLVQRYEHDTAPVRCGVLR